MPGTRVLRCRRKDVNPQSVAALGVLVSFSLVTGGTDRVDPVMQWHSSSKHLALVYRMPCLTPGSFLCCCLPGGRSTRGNIAPLSLYQSSYVNLAAGDLVVLFR